MTLGYNIIYVRLERHMLVQRDSQELDSVSRLDAKIGNHQFQVSWNLLPWWFKDDQLRFICIDCQFVRVSKGLRLLEA